jgi:hypothetical protein
MATGLYFLLTVRLAFQLLGETYFNLLPKIQFFQHLKGFTGEDFHIKKRPLLRRPSFT